MVMFSIKQKIDGINVVSFVKDNNGIFRKFFGDYFSNFWIQKVVVVVYYDIGMSYLLKILNNSMSLVYLSTGKCMFCKIYMYLIKFDVQQMNRRIDYMGKYRCINQKFLFREDYLQYVLLKSMDRNFFFFYIFEVYFGK